MWTTTSGYANYKNVTSRCAAYDAFPIDPELNFRRGAELRHACGLGLQQGEEGHGQRMDRGIDVQMYRITDRRHSDAMIAAVQRGVRSVSTPTRTSIAMSRDCGTPGTSTACGWTAFRSVSRDHDGINHQKTILIYSDGLTIFGSSNWTSASAASQDEHNYFTKKSYFLDWFTAQFDRKWNNSTGITETKTFVPLPPDKPAYQSPANLSNGVATNGQKLVWYGGPWAHIYDVYFGTDPNPQTPLAAAQGLGPSETATQTQSYALPTLQPGTTYYWKIVSKTAALVSKGGEVWSFTTAGTPPPPPPPPPGATNIVLWTADVLRPTFKGTGPS